MAAKKKSIEPYRYKFELESVHDGDTAQGRLDLGFGIKLNVCVRFSGINTAEISSKDVNEKALATRAKDFVTAALSAADIIVITEKPSADDKYGRVLGEIFYTPAGKSEAICLNKQLVEAGLAKPYSGQGKKEF